MNFLAKYFSTTYIFDKFPTGETNLIVGLAIFFSALIIMGIALSMVLEKKVRQVPPYLPLKNHFFNCGLVTGIIGLILLFFRWQSIPYLSVRFLLYLLMLAFLAWVVYIIIYAKTKFRKNLGDFYIEKRYQSYLPKKISIKDKHK